MFTALGVFLRVRQYAARRSMWNDEAALALNIVRRDYRGLLKPLDIAQGAPLGFLWVQRTAINLFGNNEYALRLFPLLGGIASMLLFAVVARRVLSPMGASLAILLFASLRPLIYYAAEAKQYSTDVAITLLLIWLTLSLLDKPMSVRKGAAWGTVGCAAVFFSHPAMFVVAACTAVIVAVLLTRGGWPTAREFAPAIAIWASGLLVNYVVSLRHLAGSSQLAAFWVDGYAPKPLKPSSAIPWIGHVVAGLVPNPIDLGAPLIVLLLVLAGTIALLRRRLTCGLVIVVVALAAVTGALLGLYPLKWRLALYLVPIVLLAAAASIDLFPSSSLAWRLARLVPAGALCILATGPVADASAAVVHPYTQTEMRSVLEHIRSRAKPGDGIYVHWTSAVLFDYYAPVLGLHRDGYFSFGAKAGPCPTKPLQQVQGHARVWVVFAIPPMLDPADNIDVGLSQFQSLGRTIERVRAPGNVEADLFEVRPFLTLTPPPRTPHPGTCFVVS